MSAIFLMSSSVSSRSFRVTIVPSFRASMNSVLPFCFLFFARNQIVDAISVLGGADNAKRFVANADTAFKVFQTIIFLPFASQFVKLTKLLIPGNKEGEEEDNGLHLEYIRKASSKFVPSTAVVEIIQEIERMAGLARENLVASMEALADKNLDKAKEINAREKIIDYLSSEITDYLVEVNRYELPLADSRRIGALFHVPHGMSNAMLLKECLSFAVSGAYEKFANLGRETGVASDSDSDETAAEKFIDSLQNICDVCEIPTLEQYGIDRDEYYSKISKMATDAVASGSPANTVKEVTVDDCIEIYKKLYV